MKAARHLLDTGEETSCYQNLELFDKMKRYSILNESTVYVLCGFFFFFYSPSRSDLHNKLQFFYSPSSKFKFQANQDLVRGTEVEKRGTKTTLNFEFDCSRQKSAGREGRSLYSRQRGRFCNCIVVHIRHVRYWVWRVAWLVLILRNLKGMGFSKTDTLTLLQTSCLVGSRAILSAISISSGRTKPKTVYTFFHSLWLAKLMKNSGPEPTHATDPLLMVEQTSNGISLNAILCVSSDPWIKANGGPYPRGAYQVNSVSVTTIMMIFEWCVSLMSKKPYIFNVIPICTPMGPSAFCTMKLTSHTMSRGQQLQHISNR